MKAAAEITGFSFEIVSTPDRDDLYAELNYRGVQWGEMCERPDNHELELKIYFVPTSGRDVMTLKFEVDGFIEVLESAKKRLLRMRAASFAQAGADTENS